MKINLDDIARGLALIERGAQNPLVRAAISKLLPDFGLTPEQLAQLDERHDDYQRRLVDAQGRS